MKRDERWWGGVGTVLYLTAWVTVAVLRRQELIALELNELGDFLAGSFGPIAFFWLVIGYMQQGKELKISSEALRWQAEELKNSVAQQTAMAKSQQSGVVNYENSVEPLLKLSCNNPGWVEGDFCCTLTLENHGDYCELLKIEILKGMRVLETHEVHSLFSKDSASVICREIDEWDGFSVRINYLSRAGKPNMQAFLVETAQEEYDDQPSYYVTKLPFLTISESSPTGRDTVMS